MCDLSSWFKAKRITASFLECGWMKKVAPCSGRRTRRGEETTLKAAGRQEEIVPNKAAVALLMAKYELTELEASWLLKAWKLGRAERPNAFACYLAGFMAGIALKTVEAEFNAS